MIIRRIVAEEFNGMNCSANNLLIISQLGVLAEHSFIISFTLSFIRVYPFNLCSIISLDRLRREPTVAAYGEKQIQQNLSKIEQIFFFLLRNQGIMEHFRGSLWCRGVECVDGFYKLICFYYHIFFRARGL